MSADFLLELRSEEIPARMQAGARADLARLFGKALDSAGLTPGTIDVWSTPRRLALIARDLPLATQALSEEAKGPRTSAPPQALEGFLRKTGLTVDQLVDRDGVWFAVIEKPGRVTADVLAEAIPALIRAFPWPKSQRWGDASLSSESLRWVRPLSGIVALLGGEVIHCEIGGIVSGRETMGHRFHHTGPITIDGADDYAAKLRAAHVILDHAERESIVREGARAAAAQAGLVLVEDEGLVIENAGLTEWPVPLLGRFDEAFLAVPPEVIQLTTRINQKYFVTENPPRNGEGDHAKHGGGASPQAQTLANAFICTANIAATDGGTEIIAGNRKVLAARLSDARFFWDQDQKTPLAEQAKKLRRITFHEKLGSLADKVARVATLAEWLAREGIVPGADPALARQAAELCKADLVTEMVGEFPELQGLMGGYYARSEGLPDDVADAIRDHYKPVGQNDSVPIMPISVAVALADKLDTVSEFFLIDEKPTGSKDPFALRRAALGVIALLIENKLRLSLKASLVLPMATSLCMITTVNLSMAGFVPTEAMRLDSEQKFKLQGTILLEEGAKHSGDSTGRYSRVLRVLDEIVAFFAERLKVQQREAGVRHDLIDAVFGDGDEDDLVRLLARVHALQAFVGTEDGANLLAGYKRAANILKKETWQPEPMNYTPEPVEAALRAAVGEAGPSVIASIAAEDFTAAMAALASLRAPIDAFFVSVTVNDTDPCKRANRLALLDEFRAAVHKVADFSRIEG
ncbi:glycine--tRNA ligase subunit beta [Novosphingobium sp.]|uniref:glycine--tRNA ligase subunit beta n=1 Tax=Novosphingobium sp. TaxID=1874826 RepID=UPI003D12D6F0